MNKSDSKTILKKLKNKTIICFTAIGVLSSYSFVKENVVPILDKVEFISDFNTGLNSLFDQKESNEPSCTKSEKIENIGKVIDKQMGNTTSWDKTSDPDTYGEAVSGVFSAFLNNGEYKTQKPTDDEIMNYIDDDLVTVSTKISADNKPDDFKESFKIVFSKFVMTDYQSVNFKDSLNILLTDIDFINGGNKFHNKDIGFNDIEDNTKLYFIDNILNMDRIIESKYPNYKDQLEDKYKNIKENINNISQTISSEKQMKR